MNHLHLRRLSLTLGFLCATASTASADQFGPFFYSVRGDSVEITGYSPNGPEEVDIPSEIDGKPVTSIRVNAFENHTGLAVVNIPEGVTDISHSAFRGCTGLSAVVLPTSLTSIGSWTFSRCTRLNSITIPPNLTSIGNDAFDTCTALVSFTVEPGNPKYASDGGVLFDASLTTLLKYPNGKVGDYAIPSSVTSIGGLAFSGCTGLTSVIIPSSVTSISGSVFEDCTGLESVTIPSSLTTISYSMFARCTGLSSVIIPSSITDIGDAAFVGCTNLTGVTLPNTITAIGRSAFYGCIGLTSVTIPSSVTSIGHRTFEACTGLTSILVENGNPDYASEHGVLFNAAKTTVIDYPDGKSGDYAIPTSVTSIGEDTFQGCTELTRLSIPRSVTYIDNVTFTGCSGLTSVDVESSNPNYSSVDGVLFSKDQTELHRYPPARTGPYIIPDSVTSITANYYGGVGWAWPGWWGYGAFEDCHGLTELTIPPTVEQIGARTFAGCTSLSTVDLADGIKHFGTHAFLDCTSLTSITLPPSFASLTPTTFRGCNALESIHAALGNEAFSSIEGVLFDAAQTTLIQFPIGRTGSYRVPDGVTTIHGNGCGGAGDTQACFTGAAFSGSSKLTSVTLPTSLTTIGSRAFSECTALTSVTIPSSVTSIGDYTFQGCTGLINIKLDQGLKRVGYRMFFGCTGLKDVTIPSSVTSIDYAAFRNCTGLTEAIFLGDAPADLSSKVFSETNIDFSVYYLSTSTGFTSPTWQGYPAQAIDESTYPAARWLLSHGLPHDTELHQDNTPLFIAYALDLNPNKPLQPQLPSPAHTDEALSLTFKAPRPELTYTVETTTDLRSWTPTGVSLSAPAPDHTRTATAPHTGTPQRYLRLVVTD